MMDTAPPACDRLHAVSHGCGQTRPQMPGKGSSRRISSNASAYLPAPINDT